MRNFREYDVWKDSIEFVSSIYNVSNEFPENERYGITNQMRRAAVSIPSNIAEGASRSSEKDFGRFIEISIGSAYELETLLEISRIQKFISEQTFDTVIIDLHSIEKRLNALRSKLRE